MSLQRQEVEQEASRCTTLMVGPEAESKHLPPKHSLPQQEMAVCTNGVRAQQVTSEMEAAEPQRFSFSLGCTFSSLSVWKNSSSHLAPGN